MDTNKQASAAEIKTINTVVDTAIKSSKDHGKTLLSAAVKTTLFAATFGQVGPLTRLFKEVSGHDAEGIRLFIVNLNAKYAPKVTGEDGEDRPISFLKYKRGEGFSLNSSANENAAKAIKAMKTAVIKAGEPGLSALAMAAPDREGRAERDFNAFEVVKRAIKTLARNGDASLARAVNKVLGNNGMTVGEIDDLAKANDPRAKLIEAEKKAEALRNQIAKMESSANQNEPSETEKEAATA